jgi:hypothetical protein
MLACARWLLLTRSFLQPACNQLANRAATRAREPAGMSSTEPTVSREEILLVEDDPDITLVVHTVPGGPQDHLNGHQFDPVAEAMYREGHRVREAYRTAMGTLSRGGVGGSMAPRDRRQKASPLTEPCSPQEGEMGKAMEARPCRRSLGEHRPSPAAELFGAAVPPGPSPRCAR